MAGTHKEHVMKTYIEEIRHILLSLVDNLQDVEFINWSVNGIYRLSSDGHVDAFIIDKMIDDVLNAL